MKLIIIRHGDPDYSIDSLTPTGWKEAELLSHRISKLDVKAFYVSPLGRAKDTAHVTLSAMGREAEEKTWLREFGCPMDADLWDFLPAQWTGDPLLYDPDAWFRSELYNGLPVEAEYRWVIEHFDALLADHGYVRDGNCYRAVSPNEDTVVLFCHFGLECVLLGHLLNISPMVLWHGLCAAPSSATTVVTEERRKGVASFRITAFGDISHLYAAGQEPAFAARFCETYDTPGQRRDP
jgi:probable phosphoglycerate mutase